ncbi:SIP domain-containing protein [Parafilimonas sp.]|uniref:SIP domain-containing protein n=1 Tax=Parafilimonas sp. TaxID=1969739 RepID=UPI0039E5C6FE
MITTAQKQKISFVENIFIKKGRVLDVRAWKPATIFEVDLHLPQPDMQQWNKTQKISCRVGAFSFRDYSPCWWDAETKTCTLFIDALHDGEGSRWVKTLQREDDFYYLHIESAKHSPETGKHLVMLGDETAIGHFNALQQLANDATSISGAIVFKQDEHLQQFKAYCKKLSLDALPYATNNYAALKAWTEKLNVHNDCTFYIAGNARLVVQLRNALKEKGFAANQIKAQGFWH